MTTPAPPSARRRPTPGPGRRGGLTDAESSEVVRRGGEPHAAELAAPTDGGDEAPPVLGAAGAGAAPTPSDEAGRLAALRRYRVLDTPGEEAFDRLVHLARELFDAEIADVSLVDGARQWLKARAGPPGAREVPRSWSFCAHAILGDGVFVVPDARRDVRFRSNPLVVGAPRIRFYAGAPLRTPDGHNLGALCVISPEPRGGFSPEDRRRLRALADMAVSELELRRHAREAEDARAALEAEMAERARAEAALREAERMAALGRLAGGLAHDMNNVLQAVAGAADLMQCQPADAVEVGRLAGTIAQAAARGASVTRRMLAFARRDALRPGPVEPGALVEGLAGLLRCAVGPGVALVLRPGGGRWSALCDADGLGRALLDLAVNARDAMPGGGTLTLSVRDVRLGEADVVPAGAPDVVPRGTPDVVARAFEPFFTTKPAGQGTGLGLSRCTASRGSPAASCAWTARRAGVRRRGSTCPGTAPPAAESADAGAGAARAGHDRPQAGAGGSEPSGPGAGAAEGGASGRGGR